MTDEIRGSQSLGALIRAARLRLGLTQDELARRAGLSRRTVVAVENGHPAGELRSVLALVRALDLRLVLDDRPAPHFSLDVLDEQTEEL